MNPGPYHHLAALVRQKRDLAMFTIDRSRKFSSTVQDICLEAERSIRKHGDWSDYDPERCRTELTRELSELQSALDARDWHSPHGVLAELPQSGAVIIKALARFQDFAERGEI